jgi:hypothetical protein
MKSPKLVKGPKWNQKKMEMVAADGKLIQVVRLLVGYGKGEGSARQQWNIAPGL